MADAVVVDSVTKLYSGGGGRRLLVQAVINWARAARRPAYKALDGVSFKVPKGMTLGVIGSNGSGKSTLLRIISGVTSPTTGRVSTHGRLVGLLELGAGFDERLTARDNVRLNGALIGMSRERIAKSIDSIFDFAELRDHIDAPLHTFSSGMVVRLGFALAVHAEADILLFDEVLAVGDVAFQEKCFRAIERFRKDNKTIVFVSHDLYAVRNVSDDVLMLHHGAVEAHGSPPEVIQRYWSTVLGEGSMAILERGPLRAIFENGRLVLWYGEKLITKGFSGYTSVRSFVRWHESEKAEWVVTQRSATRIEAEGRYRGLPAVQHWTVEIDESGSLVWEIWLTVEEELRLEREQASFMLCEDYDRFAAGGHSGRLGEFKRAVSDDWEEVHRIDAAQGAIELSAGDSRLPLLRFASTGPSGADSTHDMRVVNSDANFRGRLLQALRKPGAEVKAPGRYLYFRGTLSFGGVT
jgi:ABC-type polysaccharide/polyol phosphate transport system ATPase subunit